MSDLDPIFQPLESEIIKRITLGPETVKEVATSVGIAPFADDLFSDLSKLTTC